MEKVGEGEAEGDGEGEVVLEKKEVIWRCGLTSGDLPLLGRFDEDIFVLITETEHSNEWMQNLFSFSFKCKE